MKRNSESRLAVVRREMQITQAVLAQRCGLSTAYLKKLEGGARLMSRRPAIAIAAATGVDVHWLMGKRPASPIPGSFQSAWTPETAEKLKTRATDYGASCEDAKLCLKWFLINSHRMARVIVAGFKRKKPLLVLARVEAAMAELGKEFKVSPSAPPLTATHSKKGFSPTGADHAAGLVVNGLVEELKGELDSRPLTRKAAKPRR